MQMVVQRELQAQSRRWLTYWTRVLAAVFGIVVIWQSSMVTGSGRELFYATVTLGFVVCILDCIRHSAGAVADEIEEGTVGLLLLTPLSGPELYFGKYASVMIGAISMALAIIPLFAIAFLLGGVSFGELVRAAVALLHFLSMTAALGVVISAQSRSALGAGFGTLCVIAMLSFFFGPLLALRDLAVLNPYSPIFWIADPRGSVWYGYVGAILIWQILTCLFLYFTGLGFPTEWRRHQEFDARYSYATRPFTSVESSTATREEKEEQRNRLAEAYDPLGTPKWFKGEPFEWLTLRDIGMHKGSWGVTIATLFFVLFAIFSFPEGLSVLVIWAIGIAIFLCVASTRSIAHAKQSNLIELLMTTPLGVEGIVNGHMRALRKIFLIPCALVTSFVVIAAAKEASVAGPAFYVIGGMIALLIATPWIGAWMGLQCKTPMRAVMATLALVLLLPRLGGCFMIDLVYFVILGVFAYDQVTNKMSQIIAGRYGK